MANDQTRTVEMTSKFTYELSGQIQSENMQSALVFRGYLNKTIPIVIKRYQKENAKHVEQDVDVLSSPENRHPNFIRYFGCASDDTFR